jgi:hypothetical protein
LAAAAAIDAANNPQSRGREGAVEKFAETVFLFRETL